MVGRTRGRVNVLRGKTNFHSATQSTRKQRQQSIPGNPAPHYKQNAAETRTVWQARSATLGVR
jgi:hypothetical protein